MAFTFAPPDGLALRSLAPAILAGLRRSSRGARSFLVYPPDGLALRSPPSLAARFGPPRSLAPAILAGLRRYSRRARSFLVRPG
jgi:hypothetical protein